MSLDLNGTSDEIGLAINATLRPSLPISVGVWINPDVLATSGVYTNNKTTTTHRGIWMNLLGTGGDVEVNYGDNTGSVASDRRTKAAAAGVTAGSWQYLSCSIRGATDMSIYRNGTDVGGSYSGSGGLIAYNTGFGGRVGSVAGANFFNGRVAEVAMWTVSLSAAEHLALARGASPFKVRPSGLIQYLPFWFSNGIDLSSAALNAVSLAGTAANHAPVGCPYGWAA